MFFCLFVFLKRLSMCSRMIELSIFESWYFFEILRFFLNILSLFFLFFSSKMLVWLFCLEDCSRLQHVCVDSWWYRWTETERSGAGMLVNNRWRNPGYMTEGAPQHPRCSTVGWKFHALSCNDLWGFQPRLSNNFNKYYLLCWGWILYQQYWLSLSYENK